MPTHTASHPKIKPPRPESHAPGVAIRVTAGVAAGVLLLLGALCARWGFADLVVTDAISRQVQLETQASRTGVVVAAHEANEVIASLLRAQGIDPGNPTTAEQLGGAYTIDVQDTRLPAADRAMTRQWAKAFEQYSLAVSLRPTSPYSWANRAWTKYYQGQVDKELYVALQNAINLGPWEPEVQFVVVDLGFALWDEMPIDLRPQVLALAQNGQRRYGAQIAAIAKKRGRLAEVCTFEKLALLPVCASPPG